MYILFIDIFSILISSSSISVLTIRRARLSFCFCCYLFVVVGRQCLPITFFSLARRCLSRFVAILFQFLLVAAAAAAAVSVVVVVTAAVVAAAAAVGRVESCGMHFNAYFVIVAAVAIG